MKKLSLLLIPLLSLSIGLKAAGAGPHEGAARDLTKTAADYGMEHLPGPLWRVVAAYLEYNGGKFFDLRGKQLKKAEVVPTARLGINLHPFKITHDKSKVFRTEIAWNTPTTREFLQKYKTENSELDLTKHGKALSYYAEEMLNYLKTLPPQDRSRREDGPLHIPVDYDHVLVIEPTKGPKIYQLINHREYTVRKVSDRTELWKSYPEAERHIDSTLHNGNIDNPEYEWACTPHDATHPSYELSTIKNKLPSYPLKEYVMLKVREKAFDLIHHLFPASPDAAAGKDERKDS